MKRILLALMILMILGGGCVYLTKYKTSNITPSSISPTSVPQPNETNTNSSNCLASDFQASVSLDPGAGNIYGTLTIKNISNKVCQVIGSNLVTPIYDTQTYKNISVLHQGKMEKDIFVLNPGQLLYSQLHYPNGPQCSDETKIAKVQFTYAISDNIKITFVDSQGNKDQSVQVCKSLTEITDIKVWNISSAPITQ